MTDLQTLHDAFTELERRADAVVPVARTRRARRFRLVPIVATMAAVAALAAGAVWVAPGDTSTPVADDVTAVANLPSTEELAAKLKAMLGDMATFEVKKGYVDPDKLGVTIHGTLTANGVTGEFGLRVYSGPRDKDKYCVPAGCFVSFDWADRYGTPAVMEVPVTRPGEVLYVGYRDLPDNLNIVIGVSGAGSPPLSHDQLTLALDAW